MRVNRKTASARPVLRLKLGGLRNEDKNRRGALPIAQQRLCGSGGVPPSPKLPYATLRATSHRRETLHAKATIVQSPTITFTGTNPAIKFVVRFNLALIKKV